MKFAATVLSVGFAGMILASYLQGPASAANEVFAAEPAVSNEITGSVRPDATPPSAAVRLIDLRSGATCKIMQPATEASDFERMPMGPDCGRSPALASVTQWRATENGSLIMAASDGRTVLEFVRGDGVLYESVFPSNELITIVPARG